MIISGDRVIGTFTFYPIHNTFDFEWFGAGQRFVFSICFVPLNIEGYSSRQCTRRNGTGKDRRELSEFQSKSQLHTHALPLESGLREQA